MIISRTPFRISFFGGRTDTYRSGHIARTAPDYVFLAAGKSGGIGANQKYPAELMLDNLLIGCHVIHSAYYYGLNFISGIPANVFGPGDDFSLTDSHVIAALIRKIHEAKELGLESVDIWGTGTPRREFVFIDDLADACIFVMHEYNDSRPINLGGGSDLSIRQLAELIKEVIGYAGELHFDTSKPVGMPLKVLDSSQLSEMGWKLETSFHAALVIIYE